MKKQREEPHFLWEDDWINATYYDSAGLQRLVKAAIAEGARVAACEVAPAQVRVVYGRSGRMPVRVLQNFLRGPDCLRWTIRICHRNALRRTVLEQMALALEDELPSDVVALLLRQLLTLEAPNVRRPYLDGIIDKILSMYDCRVPIHEHAKFGATKAMQYSNALDRCLRLQREFETATQIVQVAAAELKQAEALVVRARTALVRVQHQLPTVAACCGKTVPDKYLQPPAGEGSDV